MRRILCLFLSISILILCGCNVDSNNITQIDSENKHSSVTNTGNKNANKTQIIDNIVEINNFSEDLAWIKYGENPYYWGCINKKGELLFKLNANEYDNPSKFNNGYSYVKLANGLKINVIDKNGNVCSSYDSKLETQKGLTTTITNYDEHVVAYGYGYTIMQTYKSDFDSAYYLYSIYDANGKVIDTYKSNDGEEISTHYCEKGVFYFDDDNIRHFYFTDSKKWVVSEYSEVDDVKFYDNYALLQIDYLDDDEYRGEFIFMDLSGNIKNVKISKNYGWYYKVKSIYEDVCLFVDDEKALTTYDIKTNTFSKLENENYLSKVDWERSERIICNDNVIIVPLKGADKENYVVVFDKEWNVLLEPFKATGFIPSNDDRFIINNSIYDTKGNLIFDISNDNMSSVLAYSDGVVLAHDSKNIVDPFSYPDTNFEFLDTDGKVVFDCITMLSEN